MRKVLNRYGTILLLIGLIIIIAVTTIWIYINKETKQQDKFSGAKFVQFNMIESWSRYNG
ncbi:MAG TPA: hypothetical protein GX392_04335 [Clostridiales bacterium]|nr:hypothetical protein [Clostridiales bacterium]